MYECCNISCYAHSSYILAIYFVAMRGKTKEERCESMVRSYRLMQQVLYRHHNILRKASDDLAMLYAAIGK